MAVTCDPRVLRADGLLSAGEGGGGMATLTPVCGALVPKSEHAGTIGEQQTGGGTGAHPGHHAFHGRKFVNANSPNPNPTLL